MNLLTCKKPYYRTLYSSYNTKLSIYRLINPSMLSTSSMSIYTTYTLNPTNQSEIKQKKVSSISRYHERWNIKRSTGVGKDLVVFNMNFKLKV